jgi:hypothetical protein
MTENISEPVASTASTACKDGGFDAELQDRGSNRAAEASGAVDSGNSTPFVVAIAGGDVAAMPVEKPRQDRRAVRAVVNGAAHGATRGMRADESLRAPVVASPEEIVLAEQLRLELKKKYLNEPG